MGDKCNSSIVLAFHCVPFLVDRHIDGSSKFCWPLSLSNDLIAQVCQLCHNLTVVIDGLDSMLSSSYPGALLLLIYLIDCVTSAGRTAGSSRRTTLLGIASHPAWIV